MDCSPPGSSVHGILQARKLECVAISFSRGSSWIKDQTYVSCSPALAGRFFTTEPPRSPGGRVMEQILCPSILKFTCGNVTPGVVIFEIVPLTRYLRVNGIIKVRPWFNMIGVLVKRVSFFISPPLSFLHAFTMHTQQGMAKWWCRQKALSEARKRVLTRNQPCQTLIWDF